ncbi:hypothetical protein B0O80DRAFT_4649 [Mortierella sp. GBAus27b]|nr:hypothetical protein B0O80DRAFT_4649 [Mortierella sp. GBAus27b]
MLKRISTLAKGVLRRPPSPSPLLSPQSNRSHGELSSPMTPTTAVSVSTPTTAFTLSSGQKGGYYKYPRPSIDLTLLPDNQIETVADLASTLPLVSDTDNTPEGRVAGTNDAATPLTMAEADTVTTGACDVSSPDRHHRSNRSSDARSNVSSAGSITLASSSESLSTKPSAAALRPVATRTATTTTTASTRTTVTTKTASTTTTTTKPTIVTAVPAPTSAPVSRPVSALAPRRPITTTMQRHRSFDQLQSQKATLRPGTQALIAERAESLQQQQQYSSQSTVFHKDYTQYMAHKEYLNKLQKSPTFVSRPSIDRLRTITKKDSGTRPPVQSLIDFWKQVQEPIEA